MNLENLTRNRLSYFDKVNPNLLILITFSIILISLGALTSIVLFTYNNSIQILEQSKQTIEDNNQLNRMLIERTREIPQQNQRILTDLSNIVHFLAANFNQSFIEGVYTERQQVNQTLDTILQNQKLLLGHINHTTDVFGTTSHIVPPELRNALYAVAASNRMDSETPPLTDELQSLLSTINQSQQTILNLQQQVQNLSIQARENLNTENNTQQQEALTGSQFPFAQNRIERADIPENQSMLKEPEGGRIAGFPPPK